MTVDRKTGVYLCSGCGIGEAMDMGQLETVANSEFKVPVCKAHNYLCGDEGVALIQANVASGEVNEVVVAACSQRVNQDRFRFDGTQVVRANLREQAAWCHEDGDEETQAMGDDYLRMALTQMKNSSAPEALTEGEFSRRLLVVGGGVSGLNAAREAARAGYDVVLVERSDRLGGAAAKWSKRMPHRPPYRGLQDNDTAALIADVEGNTRIDVRLGSRVTKTSGGPGKFEVEISQAGTATLEKIGAVVVATGWQPYDATKLGHLGYGASPDVVTNVELEDMLADGGAVARKSDGQSPKYVAFIQCAGSRDPDHLPYCSSICCGVSIKQALQLREADPETMIYVIYDELRTPGTAEEFYREAQAAGVIFMKGKVKGVGADLTVTVDDALLGEEVPLSGLDMVVLATGMVPCATTDGTLLPDPDINPFSAFLPEAEAEDEAAVETAGDDEIEIAEISSENSILNLQYRQGPHLPNLADGFADSHYLCFPYETRRTGIYTCGPVRRPMDMADSAEDATGAALKAIQAIENVAQGAAMHPRVGDLSYPKFGLSICTKCRRCTVECPFGAIDENAEGYPEIAESRCRRCGTCMGACPVRTISFDNYSVEMLNSMTKSVEMPDEFDEKPRILVLACENDAYPAIDMAGIARQNYTSQVRVVPVRCLGSVNLVMVSEALSSGYDAIALMGCKSGDDYQCHFVKGSAIAQERMGKIGETLKSMMLEEERIATYEISITDSQRIPKLFDELAAKVDEIGPNPFKGF